MYPCTGCGLCCKNISGIELLKQYDLGNGTCSNLKKDNKCKIYTSRPLVCRIDDMYNEVFQQDYEKLFFYKLNAKICNQFQNDALFELSYRVKIEE